MGWVILLELLWAIEDCAQMKISRWLLAVGILAGSLGAGYGWLQGALGPYEIAAGLAPGTLLLVYGRLAKGRIGRADGCMVLSLGLFWGWERCVAVLAFACLLAAGFAGAGILMGKLGRGSRICFAPFLLAATVGLWLLSGEQAWMAVGLGAGGG